MRLVDIMVGMVRQEQVAPVVWGNNHLMFERVVLRDSQVNETQ